MKVPQSLVVLLAVTFVLPMLLSVAHGAFGGVEGFECWCRSDGSGGSAAASGSVPTAVAPPAPAPASASAASQTLAANSSPMCLI